MRDRHYPVVHLNDKSQEDRTLQIKSTILQGLAVLAIGLTAASCDRTRDADASKAIDNGVSSLNKQDSELPTAPASARSSSFENLPAPYSQADYSLGRRTFKNCGSCHTVVEGGTNVVGPNLHGIFGRQAGTLEGFSYSTALEDADFEWTPDRLESWLANPRDYLPGNKMSFAGVRRPEDRHAVIAYLMVESGYEPEAETSPTPATSEPASDSDEE